MSVSRLRQLISISNILQRRSVGVWRFIRGQVSTYMLLMIAGALTLTLAMAGLSNMLSKTTNMDRVTDNASLMLASRLANKSFQLYSALGNRTEICKGTGYLGYLIIVVIIIVLIIVTIVTWGSATAALTPLLVSVGFTAGSTATAVAVAAITIAIGAAVGAAGGAIGGAVDGSGAGRGALTGAMVGAAIAGGFAAGAGAGGSLSSSIINGIANGLAEGASATIPSIVLALPLIGAAAGAAIAVGSSSYNTYVANQMTLNTMSALQKATHGLGERRSIRESIFYYGLINTVDDPNRTRLKDSTLGGCHWTDSKDPLAMQPGDPEDIDGDGNTDESQPCFAVWWIKRMRELRKGNLHRVPLSQRVRQFVKGGPGIDTPLEEMRCLVRRKYLWSRTSCTTGDIDISTCNADSNYCWGPFARKDVEGAPGSKQVLEPNTTPLAPHPDLDCISPAHPKGSPGKGKHCHRPADGQLIYVLDTLYNYLDPKTSQPIYRPSFYKPGPTLEQLKQWETTNVDCITDGCTSTNPLPDGFDEVDQMIWEMQDFADTTKFLTGENVDMLTLTIDQWLPWFYETESGKEPGDGGCGGSQQLTSGGNDYYHLMNDSVDAYGHQLGWIAKLDKWEKELNDIKSRFPKCNPVVKGRVDNAPCTGFRNGNQYWTVDSDPDGDFGRLLKRTFPTFRKKIIKFQKRILDFYNDIQGLEDDVANEWGGTGNRIMYKWDDARGPQWVEVRISPFKLASLKKTAGFIHNCVSMKDYEDPTGNSTWVRITRSPGSATRFGHLFTWDETRDPDNDADCGLGRPLAGLSKKSKAQYGLNGSQPATFPNGKINPNKWYVQLKKKQPIK